MISCLFVLQIDRNFLELQNHRIKRQENKCQQLAATERCDRYGTEDDVSDHALRAPAFWPEQFSPFL